LEAIRRTWTGKAMEESAQLELPQIRFAKLPWIESEERDCPCGSGASFADCCKAYVTAGKKLLSEVGEEDINEREKTYRGSLTQYIGYVVRYTIPALGKFPEKVRQLVQVDIKAIFELSENIALCLDRQGRTKEAIRLFRHIRETVNLPGLEKRMLYMEAIWYDAMLRDQTKAREALSIIDIEREDDIEIIQLYLSVFNVDPKQKIKLIERILKETYLPSVALHYGTLKAICIHMEGRNEEAVDVINSAIEQYAIELEHIPDHYYMNVCGEAYGMRWRLTHAETDFQKALQYYEKLNYKEFTDIGRASLYREVAELYSTHKDYAKAVKYYRLSLKAEESEEAIIHLGESYIHRGRIRKARKVLGRISYEGLAEMYRLEFLRAQALLAIKTSDRELGEDTMRKMRLLGKSHEYFEKQREETLKSIEESFAFPAPRSENG